MQAVVWALAGIALVLLLAPSAEAAIERVLVVDESSLDARVPLGAWSGKRLSLADVEGDGRLELLAHNANGYVYVIDLLTGRALVEVRPTYPYGPDLGPFNGVKAGDLDGDGHVELVSVNRAAVASAWTLVPGDEGLRAGLLWEKHANDLHGHPTSDAAPVLADLTGDGKLEVVVHTEERGAYALRHDGTTHWVVDAWGGNAEPIVLDVDDDGDLDVVFFSDDGVVHAVDGPSGGTLWRFEARRHGVWPASVPASGAAADLDGDGKLEVVFCTRNVENATTGWAPGAPSYREHHFVLFAIRDGKLVWRAKPEWGNPLCAAYVAVGRLEDEPRPTVYGMDWNTIGHLPGNWERLGDAHAFAFDADGKERWRRNLDAFNAKAAIALADATGDGRFDVLAYDRNGLVVLDARTGARLERVDLGGWSVKQGPLVADIHGDGVPHVVFAVEGRSHAILVYRLPSSGAEAPWPGWEPPVASPRPLPTAPSPSTVPAPLAPGDAVLEGAARDGGEGGPVFAADGDTAEGDAVSRLEDPERRAPDAGLALLVGVVLVLARMGRLRG